MQMGKLTVLLRTVIVAAALVFALDHLSFDASAQQRAAGAPAPAPPSAQGVAGALQPRANGDATHGGYLVERVIMCAQGHSTRDAVGEIIPGTRLHGGPLPIQVPWPADWPTQTPRIAGFPGDSD